MHPSVVFISETSGLEISFLPYQHFFDLEQTRGQDQKKAKNAEHCSTLASGRRLNARDDRRS